jgi:hypothetical protein
VTRGNRVLAGVLALQLVALAVVFWPRGAADAKQEGPLFPGLAAEAIVALTVTGPDGEMIELAKQAGSWVLPAAGEYPCNGERVAATLEKIANLQAVRLIAQTRSSHGQLGVAEEAFERLVEFGLEDGSHHRLYVGTSPSWGVSHVRANGQTEVYLASGLSASDLGTTAIAWVDRIFFELPRDEVVAWTLENANGRFVFQREGEAWHLEGLEAEETLDEANVQTLLNRATSVSMLEPLGTETTLPHAMQPVQAVVTLLTRNADGVEGTVTLRFGAKDAASGNYVMSSSTSPYVVWVSSFTGDEFAEKVREDFLVEPETPTPEETTDE